MQRLVELGAVRGTVQPGQRLDALAPRRGQQAQAVGAGVARPRGAAQHRGEAVHVALKARRLRSREKRAWFVRPYDIG